MKKTIVKTMVMGFVLWGLSGLTLFTPSASAQASSVDPDQSIIGDFIRNEDGSIRTKISQPEAAEECKRRGSRLPTARELAKEAEKQGAKLIETSDYTAEKIPDGFDKDDFYNVDSIEDGKTDSFYYNFYNYQKPSGDLGNYWIWSSSLHPDTDNNARLFYGKRGYIDIYYLNAQDKDISARCVVVK